MTSINVTFCGDSSVGKTSIIYYFVNDRFDDTIQPTVAGVFKKEIIQSDQKPVTLEIWDTAGDERYASVITSFFKKSQVVLFVYDITNRKTFEHLDYWFNIVRQNAPKDACFIIVGNKSDVADKKQITFDELADYARKVNAYSYMETSAKLGEGISDLFTIVGSTPTVQVIKTPSIQIDTPKKNKCC